MSGYLCISPFGAIWTHRWVTKKWNMLQRVMFKHNSDSSLWVKLPSFRMILATLSFTGVFPNKVWKNHLVWCKLQEKLPESFILVNSNSCVEFLIDFQVNFCSVFNPRENKLLLIHLLLHISNFTCPNFLSCVSLLFNHWGCTTWSLSILAEISNKLTITI